jgi:hypothetical protein
MDVDAVLPDWEGDTFNALRQIFEGACPKEGRLRFNAGRQLPIMDGVSFDGGSQRPPYKYDGTAPPGVVVPTTRALDQPNVTFSVWGRSGRFPRPDDMARIWRRIVQNAPDAAPGVGNRRKKVFAVTVESIIAQNQRLEVHRVPVGSNNCWTRLLGRGIPAILITDTPPYLRHNLKIIDLPKPDGLLWLTSTGLASLGREVKMSRAAQGAIIGDCWMGDAKVVTTASQGDVVVWLIRRATKKDKELASGWNKWAPKPGEHMVRFVGGMWILG